MKLYLLPITISMLPSIAFGYQMGGFDMFGRPVTIRGVQREGPCSAPDVAAQQREFFRRQQQQSQNQNQDVNQAFENLKKDLKDVSSDEAVASQKLWVERTFGLFSDLNQDMAETDDEMKKYEEAMRKQQKWVNRVIDYATEINRDIISESAEGVKVSMNDGEKPASVDFTEGTTRFNIKDSDTAFQVWLELPGVNLSDINIEVNEGKEKKELIISGQRQSIDTERVVKFSKSFGLQPTVDTEKITAKLSNGILVVTAPKEAEKKHTKRIPVSGSD